MFEKNLFKGTTSFDHSATEKIGILLANLGTPNSPTTKDLKIYLKQFLWDKRVIELNRVFWYFLLNFIILNTRPQKSAELYKKIWTKEGSPLLLYTKSIANKLAEKLQNKNPNQYLIEVGMSYGNPSIPSALEKLKTAGCHKLLILPLYPQYSGTTSASVLDLVFTELKTWRWIPELRTINSYHDSALYIEALTNSILSSWQKNGKTKMLLFSYHGIPQRYFDQGDPYYCYCQKTSRLVAERLGLKKEEYLVCFQSLFGKEEWIKPYTDVTIKSLAEKKLESLSVICPGFAVDCLETIEEINELNREIFHEHGGGQFQYIPCLNDSNDQTDLLVSLIERNCLDWKKIIA